MKRIADPVMKGFVEIGQDIQRIIDTKDFQRLKRIAQLGLASFVYPGAEHSRFQHCLGSMWLMHRVLSALRTKSAVRGAQNKWAITDEEVEEAKIAALLHDVGHPPLSHVLEKVLFPANFHERVAQRTASRILESGLGDNNVENVLKIMGKGHPRKFLNDLFSSQLDVDRLDYLQRDAFYTGVTYGLLDIDRILSSFVLTSEGGLGVSTKGFLAVQDYLIARYSMYWAVYYHKTKLAAEALLQCIFHKVKDLLSEGNENVPSGLAVVMLFEIAEKVNKQNAFDDDDLERYLCVDDSDIVIAIKQWQRSEDPILGELCSRFLERRLLKGKEFLKRPSEADRDKMNSVMEEHAKNKDLKLEQYKSYFCAEAIPSDLAYRLPYQPDSDEVVPIWITTDEGRVLKEISRWDKTRTLRALSDEIETCYWFFTEECLRDIRHALPDS